MVGLSSTGGDEISGILGQSIGHEIGEFTEFVSTQSQTGEIISFDPHLHAGVEPAREIGQGMERCRQLRQGKSWQSSHDVVGWP